MLYFNHKAVVSITMMQILTNHRPHSHITTTATNNSALWFSKTARFPNTVVISYNIRVISSTNDATSGDFQGRRHFLLLQLGRFVLTALVLGRLFHCGKSLDPEQRWRCQWFGFLWDFDHFTLLARAIWSGVHKTGIRGIQDTRQIVDGKTNDIENNDKKGGSKPLT